MIHHGDKLKGGPSQIWSRKNKCEKKNPKKSNPIFPGKHRQKTELPKWFTLKKVCLR
jgi:hypothetical protein